MAAAQKKSKAATTEKTTEAVNTVPPKKILLTEVKARKLVDEIEHTSVSFYHKGEEFEVDISIKQLPFAVTDDLQKRMDNKENVAFEWISLALVDGKGDLLFTEEEVRETFVQPMGSAIFNKVWGLDSLKKAIEKETAKSKKDS